MPCLEMRAFDEGYHLCFTKACNENDRALDEIICTTCHVNHRSGKGKAGKKLLRFGEGIATAHGWMPDSVANHSGTNAAEE